MLVISNCFMFCSQLQMFFCFCGVFIGRIMWLSIMLVSVRVLMIIRLLVVDRFVMYIIRVRVGLFSICVMLRLQKLGLVVIVSVCLFQRIRGMGSFSNSRYRGRFQLVLVRVLGEGFLLKVMWYMCGSIRVLVNDISISVCQLLLLMFRVMVVVGEWLFSSQFFRLFMLLNILNSMILLSISMVISLISELKVMVSIRF